MTPHMCIPALFTVAGIAAVVGASCSSRPAWQGLPTTPINFKRISVSSMTGVLPDTLATNFAARTFNLGEYCTSVWGVMVKAGCCCCCGVHQPAVCGRQGNSTYRIWPTL